MKENSDNALGIIISRNEASLRKGLIEYCVMLICSKDAVYTGDILAKLRGVDMIVVEGTLYPLLNRLNRENLLSYEWVESESGPPRKYYTLTDDGVTVLRAYSEHWKALTTSISSLHASHKKGTHQ